MMFSNARLEADNIFCHASLGTSQLQKHEHVHDVWRMCHQVFSRQGDRLQWLILQMTDVSLNNNFDEGFVWWRLKINLSYYVAEVRYNWGLNRKARNMHVGSVVVETVSETSHLCWNNETIRFKSSLTSIIIESTYLTLNMNKIWGCFKVKVGWKNVFYGETGSQKGLFSSFQCSNH